MRIRDMEPKQIKNFDGYKKHLQKVINGAIAAIKNHETKVQYVEVDYKYNPNQLVDKVVIYSGCKVFATITSFKCKDGAYRINYTPANKIKNKTGFTVADQIRR